MDKQYKLILFDYNGTLVNTPFVDKNPLHILPGRREKLAELRSQGIFLGVCTNQAGPLWHMATSQDKFPSALYVAQELNHMMIQLSWVTPIQSDPWYIALYDSRAMGILNGLYEQQKIVEPGEILISLQKEMQSFMARSNVWIGIDKDWRKPNPGMLTFARNQAEVEASETLYVGDLPDDELAAKNAGCDFIWADQFFGD